MIGKTPVQFSALIFCLTFALAASADVAARSSVGGVKKVQNRADAVYAEKARRLAKDSDVKMLDALQTGAEARLKVRFKDGSSFVLGENAELIVDEFVYVPKKEQTITLSYLKGALRFVGEKTRGYAQKKVKVYTPVAVLGVRGTDFWVGRIDGDTGVLVLDGEVQVRNASGHISLGPGEGTMIKDDGTLGPVKNWGKEKKRRALKMIEFR